MRLSVVENQIKRLSGEKFSDKILNVELISYIIHDNGMTQKDVADSIHKDFTTVSKWMTYKAFPDKYSVKILCDFLSVSESSLVLRGDEARTYRDKVLKKLSDEINVNPENIAESKKEDIEIPKEVTMSFKNISSLRVDECFKIINDNVLMLASSLLKGASEDSKKTRNMLEDVISKQNDMLALCCDIMDRLDVLENRDSMVVHRVQESIEIPMSTLSGNIQKEKIIDDRNEICEDRSIESYKNEILPVMQGYSPDMSWDEYRESIMCMTKFCEKLSGTPKREVLRKAYRKMNRVYGVVFCQLKRDYKTAHNGLKANTSLIAIYDNSMYRSILYCIISDMVSELLEEKEGNSSNVNG